MSEQSIPKWTMDQLLTNPGAALEALNSLQDRERELLAFNNLKEQEARDARRKVKVWKRVYQIIGDTLSEKDGVEP